MVLQLSWFIFIKCLTFMTTGQQAGPRFTKSYAECPTPAGMGLPLFSLGSWGWVQQESSVVPGEDGVAPQFPAARVGVATPCRVEDRLKMQEASASLGWSPSTADPGSWSSPFA